MKGIELGRTTAVTMAFRQSFRQALLGCIVPNGVPGDSPITDIIAYGREQYGPEIDGLIREIVALNGGVVSDAKRDDVFAVLSGDAETFYELIYAARANESRRAELQRRLLAIREELLRERSSDPEG